MDPVIVKPDKKDEVVINMADLKGIIADAIKGTDIPQIKELKAQIEATEKRAIFPAGDDRFLETSTKSVIDTACFSKSQKHEDGRRMTDGEIAQYMRHTGGPWLKLSPIMEKFAKCLRLGFEPGKLAMAGIDFKSYNAEIKQANLQMGYKTTDSDTHQTTTDLGALVPTEFLATIVEFAIAQSQILPKLWRIPMNSMTMRIPQLVQAAGSYFGGVTLYHPGEAETKNPTKPSWDYLSFTAKKMIGFVPLTDEAIADSSVNLINYITALMQRAFQYKIEGEVISGTGLNSQFTGILSDPGINWVSRQTVGTVKYEDLVNLESSLDENFRDLTFLSRRNTVNTLRKQKDSVGQPVYHDGFTTFLGGAMTPQLMGYPVIKTRNVPALGSDGDLVLGDLGMYIWAMRQDMKIDISEHYKFNYDETVLRFVMRMDGLPGVSVAFAALNNVPES